MRYGRLGARLDVFATHNFRIGSNIQCTFISLVEGWKILKRYGTFVHFSQVDGKRASSSEQHDISKEQ